MGGCLGVVFIFKSLKPSFQSCPNGGGNGRAMPLPCSLDLLLDALQLGAQLEHLASEVPV